MLSMLAHIIATSPMQRHAMPRNRLDAMVRTVSTASNTQYAEELQGGKEPYLHVIVVSNRY